MGDLLGIEGQRVAISSVGRKSDPRSQDEKTPQLQIEPDAFA